MADPGRQFLDVFRVEGLPIVSIVVPFWVNQKLYYGILTIKLVNQHWKL